MIRARLFAILGVVSAACLQQVVGIPIERDLFSTYTVVAASVDVPGIATVDLDIGNDFISVNHLFHVKLWRY